MKQVEESKEKLKATKRELNKMTSVEEKLKEALLEAEQSLKLAEDKVVVLEKEKESLQKRARRGELIGTSKRAKGPSEDGRFG